MGMQIISNLSQYLHAAFKPYDSCNALNCDTKLDPGKVRSLIIQLFLDTVDTVLLSVLCVGR